MLILNSFILKTFNLYTGSWIKRAFLFGRVLSHSTFSFINLAISFYINGFYQISKTCFKWKFFANRSWGWSIYPQVRPTLKNSRCLETEVETDNEEKLDLDFNIRLNPVATMATAGNTRPWTLPPDDQLYNLMINFYHQTFNFCLLVINAAWVGLPSDPPSVGPSQQVQKLILNWNWLWIL